MQHSSGIIPTSSLQKLVEPVVTGLITDPPSHFVSFDLLGKPPIYDQGCCGGCYAVTIATVLTMVCRAKSLNYDVHPLAIMQSWTHYGCLGGLVAGDDVADDLKTVGVSLQSFQGCRLFEAPLIGSCEDVARISLTSARQVCGHGKEFVLCSQGAYFLSESACRESKHSRLHAMDWVSTSEEAVVQTQILRHGACATVMSIGKEFDHFGSDGWVDAGNVDGFTVVYLPLRSGSPDKEYHAMTIVGWTTISTQNMRGLAWIVQNSWGSSWGDDGLCLVAADSAQVLNSSRSIHGKIFGHSTPDPMILSSFATTVVVNDRTSSLFTRQLAGRGAMSAIFWAILVVGVVWSTMKLYVSDCAT
jgi:hypothetical protein